VPFQARPKTRPLPFSESDWSSFVSNGPDAAAARPPKPRFSAAQRWALLTIACGVGLDASSVAVVNAALPEIGSNLSIAESVLQWVMSAYAVTFGGVLLFGGRLTDVFSRRLVFAAGIGVFVAGSAIAAAAPTPILLIAARVLQGIGAAISMPASLALLFEVFPAGPLRNRAMGTYTAVAGGSFSGGLIIGGVLADVFGWRGVFVFTAAFGALVLAAVRVTLPVSPTTRRRSLDLPGAVAITLSLPLIIFGVNRGGAAGWGEVSALLPLALGVVLLAAFVAWEARVAEPLLPLSILRSVQINSATVTALVSFGGVLGMLFFVPLYMQNILGFTPMESALALLAQSLAVIVFANVTARLMDRGVNSRALMAGGLLVLGIGLVSFVRAPLDGSYWAHLFPGFLGVGIGVGLSAPAMTASAVGAVPPEQRGVAGGLNATAQQIGASLGTVVLVAVAATSGSGSPAERLAGYHNAFWTAGGLVAGGLVILGLLSLVKRRPEVASEATAPAAAGN
jgi:MFS family permease